LQNFDGSSSIPFLENMTTSLESLLATGTKLWLDSIDPDLARTNRGNGATGATSNPIIVAELLASGRFDDQIERLVQGMVDRLPTNDVVQEIDRLVDMDLLEETLMCEGIEKFAKPQKALLALAAEKRLSVGAH